MHLPKNEKNGIGRQPTYAPGPYWYTHFKGHTCNRLHRMPSRKPNQCSDPRRKKISGIRFRVQHVSRYELNTQRDQQLPTFRHPQYLMHAMIQKQHLIFPPLRGIPLQGGAEDSKNFLSSYHEELARYLTLTIITRPPRHSFPRPGQHFYALVKKEKRKSLNYPTNPILQYYIPK